MTDVHKLVSLGRFMTFNAAKFRDDVTCNKWARVGKLLMEVGVPFAPQLGEFSTDDRVVVLAAARVMNGRDPMPEQVLVAVSEQPRRTRKARMTNVMRRDKRAPVKIAPAGEAALPKKRGRPRKIRPE